MTFAWVVFAQAAEYSLAPYIQMQLTHDDNLALVVDQKESLAGGNVGFGVDFVRDDQINELAFNASVQSNQYNRDRYDIDNQQLGASYQRKFERGLWRINVDGDTSSTRTSELEEGGSGRVDTEAVRVVSSAISSILLINTTEKSTLQWSLSGQYRDYDRETLRGYDAYSTALLLQRSVTQRFIMQFQLGFTEYQYLQNNDFLVGLDQQVVSPGLGFLYYFTENLSTNVLIGRSDISTEQSIGSFSSSSDSEVESYDLALNYEKERTKFSLNAKAVERPSSTGDLLQQTSLALSTTFRVTETQTFVGRVAYADQGSVENQANLSLDRKHFNTRLAYSYRWSEHWLARLIYMLRKQERGSIEGRASQNSIAIALQWHPVKKKWSRR